MSVSEISTEFKIRFKALKSHFEFMDTSPKAQYDKEFVILSGVSAKQMSCLRCFLLMGCLQGFFVFDEQKQEN